MDRVSVFCRRAAVCCAFTALYFGRLFAQDGGAGSDSVMYQFSLDELLDMQVNVASNLVGDADKQPVSITYISGEQLRMCGARTLSEAVMLYVPGFFLVEDQDDLILGFRGLAPDNNSKVMLMFNGTNVNTELFWGPSDALLNSLNFDYVERVEVIRGPGSVTLGQGALLGVINIVTKKGNENMNGSAALTTGQDGMRGLSGQIFSSKDKLSARAYFANSEYDGQALQEKGWFKDKKNEGHAGGTILNMGHRLKRVSSQTLSGSVDYGKLGVELLYAQQKKDLYNFYRDRDGFGQTMFLASVKHDLALGDKTVWKNSASFARDEFDLYNVEKGMRMGGTREDKLGFKSLLNFDGLLPGNKLAVGVEGRMFFMGGKNRYGDNFIVNVADSAALYDYPAFREKANRERQMAYNYNFGVISAMMETYQEITPNLSLLAAVRYDNHPFWGSNFSPRASFLLTPSDALKLRVSYQSGFRGAVGLHYSGGYQNDGLLGEANFGQVAQAKIPVYDNAGNATGFEGNITKVSPEKMHSFELGAIYGTEGRPFKLAATAFYNSVQNVIDVGVIWRDRAKVSMPSIGTDQPGDWNGYWYFKNTQGNIKQGGLEISASYQKEKISLTGSSATVALLAADAQQKGSMYLSPKGHFKAYPENVIRLGTIYKPFDFLSLGVNYMYYFAWFSPSDQKTAGNQLMNATALFSTKKGVSFKIALRNLIPASSLYPMNSNAGGADLADGTPSIERFSWIGSLVYDF